MISSELQECLNGMVVAQFCPYTEDDSVDVEGLRENTESIVEFAGSDRDVVLLANGSTGENYANSREEALTVVETVVKASGDLPVLAGTGQAGTKETIRTTNAAVDAGADGALVVSPYYRSPTEAGLYQYYERLAQAADIDVVAYYNADVSGARIPPSVVTNIAELDGVVGLKDGTPLISEYYEMVRGTDPEEFSLLASSAGASYVAKAALGSRCQGFFSVIGNFAPALDYELYEAVEAGEFDRATELVGLQDRFWKLVGAVQDRRSPTSILPDGWGTNHMYLPVGKAAMDLVGLNGGHVRSPEVNLSEEERSELRDVLAEMEVL